MNRMRRPAGSLALTAVLIAGLLGWSPAPGRADIRYQASPAQLAAYRAKWRGRSRQALGTWRQGFGVSNLPDGPLVGKFKAVCLLLRFNPDADHDLNHTIPFYNNLFNGDAVANVESLRNYWLEQSYGQFDLTVDTYGWFTLGPEASYGVTMSGDPLDDLVAAGVEAADDTVDFSQYDADKDGRVDFLIVIHATRDGAAPGAEVWQYGGPFAASYGENNAINPAVPASVATQDEVVIDSFFQSDESVAIRNGILCHEFGHLLGLPDLYDTSFTQTFNMGPVGIWSVMGRGIYTEDLNAPLGMGAFDGTGQGFPGMPMHLDAWSKMQLGWVQPTDLTSGQQAIAVPAIETSPTVYRLYPNGDSNSTHYFLLERRSQTGFDRPLPGEGLLIWHIDTKIIADFYLTNDIENDLTRLGIEVLQADGLHDLEQATGNLTATPPTLTTGNLGDAGDLWPGASNNLRFVPSTDPVQSLVPNSPTSDDYYGNSTGISVTDVADAANATTATVTVDAVFTPTIDILEPQANQQLVNFTPTILVWIGNAHPAAPAVNADSIVITVDGQTVGSAALGNLNFDAQTGLAYVQTTALTSGFHTLRAVASDAAGNVARGQDTAGNAADYDEVRVTVTPKTIPAGKRMISVPFTLGQGTPSFVLNNPAPKFARWDAAALRYHVFTQDPTSPFVNHLTPGRGYWVSLNADVALQLRGTDVPRVRQELTFETPNADGGLPAGWYMIATPFDFDLDFNSLQVTYQGRTLSLQDAVDDDLVGPALYTYDRGLYTYEVAPDGQLEAFVGYWIRVLKAGVRLYALPLPSGRAAAGRAGQPSRGEGWLVQLSASSTTGRDTENYFGVSSVADSGRGSLDVEEPPPAVGEEGGLQVSFVRSDWGTGNGRFAQEVRRGPLTGSETWDVLVTGAPGERVLLSWGDLSSVPPKVRLTLTDPLTGKSVYMRTSRSHHVVLDQDAARWLRLTASVGVEAPLRLTGLQVKPTRGGGYTLAFQSSAAVTAQLTVRSASGRTVQSLPVVAGEAGLITRQWNGRDASGQSAPRGFYVLEVVARSDSGQLARRTAPFVVSR